MVRCLFKASHLLIHMKYTHVIWDFNGTVLRDMEVGIRATNRMLAARGLATIADLEAYRAIFGFPVEAYYRRVGFDMEREDYKTVLAPEWVAYYNEYSKQAPLFDGVAPLCAALRAVGVHQSILSASEKEMMLAQLQERGAQDWFDEIWGTGTIHAVGKLGLADAWRAAHPDARAVLLGDTDHDFAVAMRLGADCILVADGHQPAAKLSLCACPVVPDLFAAAAMLGLPLKTGN